MLKEFCSVSWRFYLYLLYRRGWYWPDSSVLVTAHYASLLELKSSGKEETAVDGFSLVRVLKEKI